jgi:Tol biopolymer transport system component
VFRSNRRGAHELYETPATDSGKERLVHSAAPFGMYPSDWGADGNVILFHVLDDATRHDIWKLDLSRRVAEPLLRTKAEEAQGQLGPGGRLAYTSDSSGTMQVFIRPLNGSDFPTNVSTEGGFDPRWRADGRELYFISPRGMLMAAEVPADNLHASPARPLFLTPIQATKAPFLSDYVVTKDGSRFLMKVPTEPPGTAPITITTNWLDRLRATR